MMDDEIPVINEGGKSERRENIRTGMCVVIGFILLIPGIVVAIPVVAALYRWGFGG